MGGFNNMDMNHMNQMMQMMQQNANGMSPNPMMGEFDYNEPLLMILV